MVGSHYNRGWAIHSAFRGTRESTLSTITDEKNPPIPDALNNYYMDNNSTTVGEIFIQNCSKLLQECDEFRKEVATGSIAKRNNSG